MCVCVCLINMFNEWIKECAKEREREKKINRNDCAGGYAHVQIRSMLLVPNRLEKKSS